MDERNELATQTLHFFIIGSIFGMFFPLLATFILHGIIGTPVVIGSWFMWVNLLYLVICFAPLVAYFIYTARVDYTGIGNWLLYITSVIAIILNVFMVQLTGGFDKSVFKFFFFYIPSAVAISFHAKRSMIIMGVACFLGIWFCYDHPPHSNVLGFTCWSHETFNTEQSIATLIQNTWFKSIYFWTMVIHLGSIILLELVKPEKMRVLKMTN